MPLVLQYVYQNDTEQTGRGSPAAVAAWSRHKRLVSLLLWGTTLLGLTLTILVTVGVLGKLA